MEIKKETIVAGVIGGITSLAILFAYRKLFHCKGHCKGKGRWGGAEILNMESEKLPKAIGPYSKGKMIQTRGGTYAWSSGQLGLDPATGELVQGEDPVVAQAEQVLKNLQNLATDNGFDFQKHTVKNVVYLVDMADFAKVNEVYKKFYTEDFPARTCIAIKALPKGGLVEIESVFYKPKCHGKC